MLREDDYDVARLAATLPASSIVAAAGCGKTEQIARATEHAPERRLILTHTHAGVDALKGRLRDRGVPASKYRIDTIAGWSLRFAASYPLRSGIPVLQPSKNDWDKVYKSAAALIRSGAVLRILKASYSGLFVDEYQDCTFLQHEIIRALAGIIPTCVFGDYLQAIFEFKEQKPVDWETDVFPVFPKSCELLRPWRWENTGNPEMAEWLASVRSDLDGVSGNGIDLTTRPSCVHWEFLPAASKDKDVEIKRRKSIADALRSIEVPDGQKLVVIADSANVRSRVRLARNFAQYGCSNIEAVDCPDLFTEAAAFDNATGTARLDASLALAAACMTGTEKSELTAAVHSHLKGGKRCATKFGDVIPLAIEVIHGDKYRSLRRLLVVLHDLLASRTYRREMYHALCTALQLMDTGDYTDLESAVWEAQNRTRHRGRVLGKRSIGSTLLIKGLQFDHALILDAHNLDRKHLYVALTRATRSVTILSPSRQLVPKPDKGK